MIDNYNFGKIVVDGTTYLSDIIIFPDRIQSSWWRENGHVVSLKDIKTVLDQEPELLIIGSGRAGLLKVNDQVVEEIKKRGIKLIVEKTDDAVKTFNRYCEQSMTVGAFHLTC